MGKHKDYDAWYICPCTTGICKTRNIDVEETVEGNNVQTVADEHPVPEGVETVQEATSGDGSGPENAGTSDPGKRPATRGRPRKGTNK